MKLRALLFGLVIFAPFECAAEQYGNWFIGTLQGKGQKTGCHMLADYNQGVRLGVVVFKNYAWALSLEHDSWKMKEGQLVEMAAFVDGNMVATGKAEALNSTLPIPPLDKAVVYRALQAGHTLVLTTPSGKLPFDLRGYI